MKKKLVSTILAATAVGSMLVTGVSAEEAKTYNIGICQLVQHVALDAATEGFKDALTDKFGDAVNFDEQNAQGDSNTCSTTAVSPVNLRWVVCSDFICNA